MKQIALCSKSRNKTSYRRYTYEIDAQRKIFSLLIIDIMLLIY